MATGVKGPPEDMLRFVLSPEGEATPDLKRKLPGRGVWTQLNVDAVRRAATSKSFARGFKAPTTAPPDLAERVDALLETDALQFLSLANKAGLAVAGAAKVETALSSGRTVVLIQARDGGSDGTEKMVNFARSRLGDAFQTLVRINIFASAQLDLALGRTNVIHAALADGEASRAFAARAARLARYRGDFKPTSTAPS